MNDPRGSIWRKWDFHVHPPGTKLSDRYISSGDPIGEFLGLLSESDVQGFGITDYCSIENFKLIQERWTDFPGLRNKVAFPNIEFRLSVTTNKENDNNNIHILFDNSKPTLDRVDRFLNLLPMPFKNIDGTKPTFSLEDLRIHGFEKALVNLDDLLQILNEVFGADRPFLIIGVAHGYGGIRPPQKSVRKHALAAEIDKSCDLFFGRAADKEQFLDTNRFPLAKRKPVVSGSDAHSFDDLKIALGRQVLNGAVLERDITWIKADLTFTGLKQLLNEPSDRVFVGECPPKLQLVSDRPHSFIESILISSTADNGEWFDRGANLPLNPDLVSIIGNKGMGKSALADLIAATANSDKTHYSFLNANKFLAHPSSLKYSARLTFHDGYAISKKFVDHEFDPTKPTRAVYLSQSFVNELCESDDPEVLQDEINRVVYSHIPPEEKQDAPDLKSLMYQDASHLDDQIASLRAQLLEINKQIVRLEHYEKPEFRQAKVTQLEEQRRALASIEKSGPPPPVSKPNQVVDATVTKELKAQRDIVHAIERDLPTLNNRYADLIEDQKELRKLSTQYDNVVLSVRTFRNALLEHKTAVAYKISAEELTIPAIIISRITVALNTISQELVAIKAEREAKEKQKHAADGEIKKKQASLSQLERKYQEFLEKKKQWEKQKQSILGDKKTDGTILALEHWIKSLDEELAGKLADQRRKRKQCATAIVKLIFEKKAIFENYYQGIKKFSKSLVSQLGIPPDEFVDFVSEVRINELFFDTFLENINKNRKGTFHGLLQARKELIKLVSSIYLQDRDELVTLPDLILEGLKYDLVADPNKTAPIADWEDQLVRAENKNEIYDFIYSFSYLNTSAEILYSKKKLSRLSPGEKGNVLLIFYLLLDKEMRPIIIDQPEENLDNETIYKVLVPLIKRVKQDRQIIIVTHNPNLAVVCDSEQIIRCSMKKNSRNLIQYQSGSIEESGIRQGAVNILEGTEVAFKNRKSKYELS